MDVGEGLRAMSNQPLGRRVPTDFRHMERYPLRAAQAPSKPTPVVVGVNWYENFDRPWQDRSRHWWIGTGNLGRIRGGHCVCLKPKGVRDNTDWWGFYDQGSEGACVGFGASRMMTLLNRKRYDAWWLYRQAQAVDEWTDTPPEEGTSVRAGLDILRTQGHWPANQPYLGPQPTEGIAANRWARSIDDVLDVLGYSVLDYVDILNSWGRAWPHLVRMPATTLERLFFEDGEFGVVTDL
jgi:hypothetical protein